MKHKDVREQPHPLNTPYKKPPPFGEGFLYGAPGEIRTPDQVVRSHLLYPAELRVHKLFSYRLQAGSYDSWATWAGII